MLTLNYQTVESLAHAYCDLQRTAKGDNFATENELVSIHADIFGWLDLWLPALMVAIGRKHLSKHDVNVDHYRKTVTVVA